MLKRNSILNGETMIGLPVLAWADDHPGTIVLESANRGRSDFSSYIFAEPSAVLSASALGEVQPCLSRLEDAVAGGAYAAGCIMYEAGGAFENIGEPGDHTGQPLLWFGIYENPLIVDHRSGRCIGGSRALKSALSHAEAVKPVSPSPLSLTPTVRLAEYLAGFDRVQALIEAGDTYQVNLTFKLKGTYRDSPVHLYDRMRHNQRVKYGAFANLGTQTILSCSPELFFRSDGRTIVLKPMKGTASRGRTLAEDREKMEWLRKSAKNRAENMMIVDLLRNDVGRIARSRSVNVERFFDIEEYETVFQATSTIRAKLKKNITIGEMVRCLFPSGSVTGAPKIRTMQLIRELELEPRGVYTGCIGFFGPSRKSVFSVAIRTAVIGKDRHAVELGVGSGVVHDSVGREEYAECLAKARFLENNPREFDLFETIRWDAVAGMCMVRLHLKRLRESAEYFGFCYEQARVRVALRETAKNLLRGGTGPYRIRLLLARNGNVRTEPEPLIPLHGTPVIGFSDVTMNSNDPFLFHKTTLRDVYENELRSAVQRGFFDVVFCNEKGEIMEGARSNVVVRFGDRYFTPPAEVGLLCGVYRGSLLQGNKIPLKEKILYPDDLFSADEVFVCNALRGLVAVTLDPRKENR